MLRKICSILTTILMILLAAIAAILIVPSLMGYKSMAVLSGSMEPGIPVGSIIYVGKTDPAELKVGDIVTYQISGETMVTHRVEAIDYDNRQITTKGDANENADASPVDFTSVVGKASFHLPFIGYISIYAKTPLGIAAVCGVLVVLILLNFLPDIFSREDAGSGAKPDRKKGQENN